MTKKFWRGEACNNAWLDISIGYCANWLLVVTSEIKKGEYMGVGISGLCSDYIIIKFGGNWALMVGCYWYNVKGMSFLSNPSVSSDELGMVTLLLTYFETEDY